MPPVWFRITKYYQILTKCFGDDEVIQHWQQKLKWLSSCGLLWIYDPFLFSWSSSTKEKGRPYYTLGALLVSSRKSRHAWFTSTRDVMSPSPPREMDTVLPPLLLFVIPSNHQVPAPYLPFLLCSSYFPLSNPASTSNPSPTSTPIPNLPLSYFLISVVASTTTTTTTSSREEKTQWSVLLLPLQQPVTWRKDTVSLVSLVTLPGVSRNRYQF